MPGKYWNESKKRCCGKSNLRRLAGNFQRQSLPLSPPPPELSLGQVELSAEELSLAQLEPSGEELLPPNQESRFRLSPLELATGPRLKSSLAELSRQKRLAFAERMIGSSVLVLFEGGHSEGLRLGTTAHYLKVGVPVETDLTNQVHRVRITGASDRWAVGQLLGAETEGTRS